MSHKIIPAAKQIMDDSWPTKVPKLKALGIYRDMQAELLQLHFPEMDAKTRVRAIKTFNQLQKNRNQPLI